MLPFISGIFRTDDRGIYRIIGVPPGAYKVSVGASFTVFRSFRGRPAYKQGFYPGVSDESRARVIEVTEGALISDIDINVGSIVKTFSASGRIVDGQTGQTLNDISYDLDVAGLTGGGKIPRAGSSDQRGEFRLENLPAGRYSVIISEPESGKSSEKTEFLGNSSWFEIREADVGDIEVRAVKTISVSGRLVIENTQEKSVLANLPKLELLAELLPKSGGPYVFRLFRPDADGGFSVRGLKAGKLRILLNSAELGASLGLRFRRMGFDVSLPIGEIEIKDGESITGLRVVLGYGSSRVRGVVRLQNGPLPPNTRVHARVTNEAGFYAGQWVDSRGNFLIDAVPPGEYTLTVTVEVPGKRTLEPEARQPISVSEGVVFDATITLDLGSLRTPVP